MKRKSFGLVLGWMIAGVGMLTSVTSRGQGLDGGFDETLFVPETQFVSFEQSASLESLTGILLLDDTRTKNGRDFYEYLYQQWLTIQSDTTIISPSAFSDIGEELNVNIEEQPVPGGIGTSTVISVTVNDVMIYQQFLQPRLGIIEGMAGDAASIMTQYIQNYQAFQNQLGSEDQKGTGIY